MTPVQMSGQHAPELPLDHAAAAEPTLRWAHARAGLEMSFEQAMADPLISRCLHNVVTACQRARRKP